MHKGKSDDLTINKIEKGVRQSCVLPTAVFQYVQRALNGESGLELSRMICNNIRFGNDTVLLASKGEDL